MEGYNMASYTKRYGKWQARISWNDSLGKRHRKTKNGFTTKAEAKKWAASAEVELTKGIKVDEDISFSSYYQDWFKKYKEPKLYPGPNQAWYLLVGKMVNNYFGKGKIKQITRSQYQGFLNGYAKDHSPASVRKTNNIIRQCVKSAILDGLIIRDFTQNITLGGNKGKELNVDYLNLKEIKELLKEAKTVRCGYHLYTTRYMIVTAIYTGMRLGEIQALTWDDIDLKNRIIDINKSWDGRRRVFKPTKTKSSIRKIKMNNDLCKVLTELHKRNPHSKMVFENFMGTVPTTEAVNHTLKSLLDFLGIQRHNFHFHSLRHSHVAILLAKGVDIYAISKRLGHSNISTTTRIYAYLIDEYKKENDKKIVKALDNLDS